MDFTRLDRFMDELTDTIAPGNDIIIIKDGQTIHRYMSGYADIEKGIKIKGDETYNMWSCSKVMTVTAVMTLYEQGKFNLNDPVWDYMPEFAETTRKIEHEDGSVEYVKPTEPIRIRHLMSMGAGFEYDLESPQLKELKKTSGGRVPTRDAVREMAKSHLTFDPGEHWQYSMCHDILGGFIEVVSGKRFSDYVKEAITDPLGLCDSTFAAPDERLMSRMARQYGGKNENGKFVPTDNSVGHRLGTEYESGGAGLTSTVEDYSKFGYALANGGVGLNGARILASRTVDLMRTNAISEQQRKDMSWGDLRGYGYGLGVRTMVDRIAGGSNGPVGEFGWAGAAGSWVMIDPENKLCAFYAEHTLNNHQDFYIPRLRNIIYSCLD